MSNWRHRRTVRIGASLMLLLIVVLFFLLMPAHWYSFRLSPFDDISTAVHLEYSPAFHLDIGTVDINNDSYQDIFTVNCFCQQSLLLNNGDGSFTDELATRGLSQNPDLPHFECHASSEAAPETVHPGINIYNVAYGPYQNPSSAQVVHWKKGGGVDSISGSIEFHCAPRVIEATNTTIRTEKEIATASLWKYRLSFEDKDSATEGKFVFFPIDPTIFAVNYQYELFVNGASSPEHIYFGKSSVNPASSNLVLRIGDRHGFAWADYDKNGSVDLFIARGGMKGRLAEFQQVEHYNDELFRNDAGTFKNIVDSTGIQKNGKRGRQSMWIDVNQDGHLDLYLVNYRTKNQLYVNQGDGTFIDMAPETGLDVMDGDVAAWLDYDQDGDMDLVLGGTSDMVFVNNQGVYDPVVLKKTGRNCIDMSLGDYDNDLDLDLLVMHDDMNLGGEGWGRAVLYENSGGKFAERPMPEGRGFPERGLGACWIDYDNDGFQDIYMAGEGLYRNLGNGSFERTRLLSDSILGKKQLVDEVFHWFDHNNDGYSDVIIVREYGGLWKLYEKVIKKIGFDQNRPWLSLMSKMRYSCRFHENRIRQGNWISISLQGAESNREGIGCKLWVTAGDSTQYSEAGFNGRIYRSQSRNRLLFGVGENERIDEIKVQWPSGIEQIIHDVEPNTIMTIAEAPSGPAGNP